MTSFEEIQKSLRERDKILEITRLNEEEKVYGIKGTFSYALVERIGRTDGILFDEASEKVRAATCLVVFTDQRLMIVEKKKVSWKEMLYHCINEIPYEEIVSISDAKGISISKYTSNYLSIYDSKEREHRFYVQQPQRVVPLINNLIYQRSRQLQAKKKILVIDFASLWELLMKKGIVIQVLSCPKCGGEISLPKSGNATACRHCGNSIFAMGVFETLRKIHAGALQPTGNDG